MKKLLALSTFFLTPTALAFESGFEEYTLDDLDSRPDLRIAEILVEGDATETIIDVVVENAGSRSANGFYVDLFLDAPTVPAEGQYGEQYRTVSRLKPGALATVSFTTESFTAEPGKARSIHVLLDTDQWVTETVEGNGFVGLSTEPILIPRDPKDDDFWSIDVEPDWLDDIDFPFWRSAPG